MRITVAAVGRARGGPEQALFDSYAGRLPWTLDLKEVEARGRGRAAAQRRREATLLLAALPGGASVVALDAGGEPLDSDRFAQRLARWRDGGVRELAFVIGGADGLDAEVLRRAELVLSLGRMTWPHLLVRAMLAEQLYRAHAILSGHPYHRG